MGLIFLSLYIFTKGFFHVIGLGFGRHNFQQKYIPVKSKPGQTLNKYGDWFRHTDWANIFVISPQHYEYIISYSL